MQDNEVSLEQLKSVYKAHTEAYLDFNMALINILSNQKEIINKVESLKVLSDEEFKNLSKEYAVLEKLFENFQMTQTKRDADLEEATIWINGLDRINNSRGILRCFDLSATPFVPSGKQAAEEALFSWIVSDFGLNDAIESGLVKTPRVVVRDDSKELDQQLKSKLYHIYGDEEVKDDLNRKDETNILECKRN